MIIFTSSSYPPKTNILLLITQAECPSLAFGIVPNTVGLNQEWVSTKQKTPSLKFEVV